MISITPEAAAQIRTSAKEQHLEGLPLRVAAQRLPDGKFHYAMGFDEADHRFRRDRWRETVHLPQPQRSQLHPAGGVIRQERG